MFLRLSNCASVGEKTLIIIKMHGTYVKKKGQRISTFLKINLVVSKHIFFSLSSKFCILQQRCVCTARTLCTKYKPKKSMKNYLPIVSCHRSHNPLLHTNTSQFTLKWTFYLNLWQCYVFLSKYDLCVYSLKMATYQYISQTQWSIFCMV